MKGVGTRHWGKGKIFSFLSVQQILYHYHYYHRTIEIEGGWRIGLGSNPIRMIQLGLVRQHLFSSDLIKFNSITIRTPVFPISWHSIVKFILSELTIRMDPVEAQFKFNPNSGCSSSNTVILGVMVLLSITPLSVVQCRWWSRSSPCTLYNVHVPCSYACIRAIRQPISCIFSAYRSIGTLC